MNLSGSTTRKKRSMLIRTQQLQDFPELIHRIQLLLPLEEAARTSVLSKSWLHAWYTIPNLRFPKNIVIKKKEKKNYSNFIDSTLVRYIESNIPIESFDLHFLINNDELASLFENLIQPVISKTCLKELSLIISMLRGLHSSPFTFPDEIFSGENLIKISLRVHDLRNSVWISKSPVIKCFSLRVLELLEMRISEDVLNNLLSTCTLLEKINISCHQTLKTFKVKSLRCLRELKLEGHIEVFEIDDVPSLRLFHYRLLYGYGNNLMTFKVNSLPSVTELFVGGQSMAQKFLDLIESKFPFVETLTFEVGLGSHGSMVIRCHSLKRLTVQLQLGTVVKIQVYTPKLHYFCFDGWIIPSIMFSPFAPEQIKLKLSSLEQRIDHLYFVKIRDVLNLSSKFDIEVMDHCMDVETPVDIDIDVLRSSLPFPAKNVQQLSFTRDGCFRDGCSEKHMQYFIAFFTVCHPDYVHVYGYKPFTHNMFYRQMLRLMTDNKTPDLKDVAVKNPCNGEWDALTNYWRSFHSDNWYSTEFKLDWC